MVKEKKSRMFGMAGGGKKYDYIVQFHPYELLKSAEADTSACMDMELAFTEAHRSHLKDHPAIREAYCLKELFPRGFQPVVEGDCFAGWLHFSAVGLGQEGNSGGVAYYCYDELLDLALETCSFTEEKRQRILDMKEYWRTHTTFGGFFPSPDTAIGRAMSPALREAAFTGMGSHGDRLAGINLDFDKLVRLGLNGLIDEAKSYLAKADDVQKPFYQGVIMAMETVQETCRFYARQAYTQAVTARDNAWKTELETIGTIMDSLAKEPPKSFRAAVQLVWLYHWCATVVNYSRLDIAFGDLLDHDLSTGVITEDEAQRLTNSLWKMIARTKITMNSRVIIGGKGRRNEKNADRFAMLAMEAARQVVETEPQLTLRFYKGQDPKLMQKALDVIGSGVVYPMLFNDDANIPSVMNSFRCTEKDAEHYLPYGCGELGLDHLSVGSPNTGFTPCNMIEGIIFNGKTTFGDRDSVKPARTFEELKTFEEFYAECRRLMFTHFRQLSERQKLEHDVNHQEAAYLLSSALTDDCMSRGLSMNGGGARYLGGVIETFGLVNACDSITAVKKLIYDEQVYTKDQLRTMLYEDWEGYEKERKSFVDVPKFGNDDEEADGIFKRFCNDMCEAYNLYAPEFGLDYFLACNVNNRENVRFGEVTPATPDGRYAWTPLANGNTPTSGNDKKGITALLSSMAKAENNNNSGFTHNLKFSKSMFNNERPKVEAMLNSYFDMGGTSVMITCVGKEDLEKAQKNPDDYKNLMVRVGGFSARFVELEPNVQDDIIKRTMY